MRFSKEVSLITFILGLFTSYLCYTVNIPEYKIIDLFFAFFASYFIYKSDGVIGAMWCFFAVFAPLFFYILTKTKVL